MTIIRPKKENYVVKYLIGVLLLALVIVAVSGVYLYNASVNIKHEINQYKVTLRDVEVKNAELKNNYYNLTNPQAADQLVQSKGLLVEKNPEYVKKELLVVNN